MCGGGSGAAAAYLAPVVADATMRMLILLSLVEDNKQVYAVC